MELVEPSEYNSGLSSRMVVRVSSYIGSIRAMFTISAGFFVLQQIDLIKVADVVAFGMVGENLVHGILITRSRTH